MIEARGLTKTFGDLVAVNGVDVHVDAGVIVGLVGANGAGKTTLLRMLCGILQPAAGSVSIAGHALVPDDVEARRHLAFVPDTPMLFDQLTVDEHLRFVAELYRVPAAERGPRSDTLLAEFELAGKHDAPAGSLSRGMRQKLAICCALLHRPSVLLLDEPLTGLDPMGRRRMCDAIAARAAAGVAVLVSSHQLEIVERLSHRFLILHQGRALLEGTLDEIRAAAGGRSSLEDVFLQLTAESGA